MHRPDSTRTLLRRPTSPVPRPSVKRCVGVQTRRVEGAQPAQSCRVDVAPPSRAGRLRVASVSRSGRVAAASRVRAALNRVYASTSVNFSRRPEPYSAAPRRRGSPGSAPPSIGSEPTHRPNSRSRDRSTIRFALPIACLASTSARSAARRCSGSNFVLINVDTHSSLMAPHPRQQRFSRPGRAPKRRFAASRGTGPFRDRVRRIATARRDFGRTYAYLHYLRPAA